MRLPRLINEFVKWRWAPCAALIVGSLAFVALALISIPSGPSTAEVAATANLNSLPLANATRLDRPASGLSSMFGAALPRPMALNTTVQTNAVATVVDENGARRDVMARQAEAAADTPVPSLTPVVPIPADAVPAVEVPALVNPDAPHREN